MIDRVEVGTLTSSSGQHFEYSGPLSHLAARSPAANTDDNIREVFWPADSAPRADQEVCTVWNDSADSPGSPGGNRQMGLALRIAAATDDGRGIKAITLTQNVYSGATWVFWVDVWSVLDPAHPNFAGVTKFDLLPVVGYGDTAVAPPWNVCAQVDGATFRFKIWTGTDPEPTWRDATRVFSTRLPDGWDYPGHAGGFVGHLRSTQSASFSNLVTRPVRSLPTAPRPSRDRTSALVATPVLGWPTYIG